MALLLTPDTLIINLICILAVFLACSVILVLLIVRFSGEHKDRELEDIEQIRYLSEWNEKHKKNKKYKHTER